MLISIHGNYFETVSFLLALSFSIGDNHGKARTMLCLFGGLESSNLWRLFDMQNLLMALGLDLNIPNMVRRKM